MLNHTGTMPIETERLILKKLSICDADAMYHNFASDENVARYMSWKRYESVEQVKKVLEEWQNEYKDEKTYYWGIFLKTGELIGTVYLYTESEAAEVGSVSYCIGSEWQNKGYMTEALKAVIDYGFQKIGYNRLEAYHAKSNTTSGKVMLKSGMTFEGVLRQRCKTYNGFEDCYFYSLLKSEYHLVNIIL